MLKQYLGRLSESYHGDFIPITEQELKICNLLKESIEYLSSNIGERNAWTGNSLNLASEYIKNSFERNNLETSEQIYQLQNTEYKNIIARKKGTSSQFSDEIIVIGAHYDSVLGSPGADDNASGIAALLAIAELIKNFHFDRTLELVAFVNEEPPFFFSRKMGSWQYAKRAKEENKKIIVMFSIESIGYYSNEINSQQYPFPWSFFYPNIGNFIGFVSNIHSKNLLNIALTLFRKHCLFPSEGIATPWFFPGVFWSDHLNFWRHGYPAIMITDTAPFRNPYYHTKNDLPHTLNYDYMARVVNGLMKLWIEMSCTFNINNP